MRLEDEKILIVNADDLGRSPGIDDGIFAAHRSGIVTSATLMVGFPSAVEAGRRLSEVPQLGVGLHLTLTGAEPTLPADKVPSLVDSGGRLARRPELLGGLRPRPTEILAEMRHQLDRFRELTGREPTHLDSHHHSHREPIVLDALVRLARECGLPVRRASPEIAARLAREGIATTDTFVEHFYGDQVRADVLREILVSLPDGVSELMCHPGHADETLRRESTYADQRELEFEILTDPDLPDLLEAAGIRLAHFGTLCASRG